MSAIAAGFGWNGAPRVNENTRRFELSDKQKERARKDCENQFHKYTICGVEIVAKSKKDAKRIYNSKKL